MKRSPTARSLDHLRDLGYVAAVVEQHVTRTITRDLFGFVDIIAVKPGETLAVQTTSASNVSSRVRKIADAEHLGAVREAGWRIEVHGWRDDGRLRVVDVS